MIKKIRVWKTVILSFVTLGIYTLIWFCRRRDEMVKHYKVSIPHWIWLIAPAPLAILVFVGACAIVPIKAYDFSDPAFTSLVFFVTFFILLVDAIWLWWTWQFGKATEKITRGKITLGWVIAYAALLGPVIQYILQYHFNRLPKKVDLGAKKYKPSQKFISISVLAIVTSLIAWSAAAVYLTITSEDLDQPAPQLTKEQYSKLSRSNELLEQYNTCVDKLNSDFPSESADASQEEAYSKAYDNCESIRVEQNTAADEYNKSIGQ